MQVSNRFPPSHTEALRRLEAFLPHAGADYARLRNFDLGPDQCTHVSQLSPYLRTRLITEQEVLERVLAHQGENVAEKFIQEVFWRTYWKGWLALRPGVWDTYQAGLRGAWHNVQAQSGLRQDWEAACQGQTGVPCFDHWATELVQTGYLHNHARMWFASIWIFTLRLPWELGADFFLRHLHDGDPASNTLSWRWVGGLQTRGKTYLARASNIAKFTQGRFDPQGQLADAAMPLDGPLPPDVGAMPVGEKWSDTARTGLLLTPEDLAPEDLLAQGLRPVSVATIDDLSGLSPLQLSAPLRAFTRAALADGMARVKGVAPAGQLLSIDAVLNWAAAQDLAQIVTPYAPVGPHQTLLDRLEFQLPKKTKLIRWMRPYDARAWPHATHGFFRFKDKIPKLLQGFRQPDLLD